MEVILVDEKDNVIGKEEKIKAHQKGLLHRAFSVFVFNQKKELLMQKRSEIKYHSAGLWSNTCCSHPSPGERTIDAAEKRLQEEMGFTCKLKEAFEFIYKAEFPDGLIEHEYDHVFIGKHYKNPEPDPLEVSKWMWISLENLKKDIQLHPKKYTEWLNVCLEDVIKAVSKHGKS